MDFYLWSTLKSRVYFNFVPQNLAELQNKITEAIKDIDQDELKRAIHHLKCRLELVLQNEGGAVEHLL